MTQKISSILIGFVATALASVQAGMTPDALAALAVKQNPELNFYIADIEAAKGTVRTARTVRNPELSTQAGYKNSRDNSGGPSGDGAAWSLSFTQTFEYPGRIALRKAIANHDVHLAELHLQQFRLTLAARVRTLAYGVSSAHEKSTAAREVAGRFQALTDVLAQRPAAGVTPQLEARIIRANMVTFRRQEREAALTEATMTAELNQLCGRSANAARTVNAGTVSFRPASLPNLLNAARSNAFEIRIRQVELARQGVKVALSKNERYPAVAVGPYYLQENAADREQQVGLGISLPLPLWDRNTGNIATSKGREQQAQTALLVAKREVERRVTQSVAILETKRAEIENLKADELAKFREAAELADRNYQLGAVSLTIYVETQKQYLELVTAANDLQKDALQAAQALEILTSLRLYREEERP
jgi:cobalt-zinc-cadmium efflux system outer membrane protein